MFVKGSRVVSTHVAVRDAGCRWFRAGVDGRWRALTAIDDILQLLPPLGSLLFIDPIGLKPVVVGDQPKIYFAGNDVGDTSKFRLSGVGRDSQHTRTHCLNSSVNGSSFKKTHGYWNFSLNRSWIRLTLRTALSRSLFLASITIVALALRTFKGLLALKFGGM